MAVVGGGITGLAAAYYLQEAGAAVTVVEAGDRFGGKIRTDDLAGVPVEAGPDTFLARVPEVVELCRALGLGDRLVAPATGVASVWARGRLRPLPEGHVLGVPTRLGPLVRSGVLSPAGVARAALDLVLPRRANGDDPSVAAVIGTRMGREVVDRLVEPLVGGINAGRADRLSLAATAKPLAEAAAAHRSLVVGLRRRPAPDPAAGPVFLGVAGGLEGLVNRLRTALVEGADVRMATAVTGLDRLPHGGWRLVCRPGPPIEVEACVLTVPAPVAARLLGPLSERASAALATIRYASVALATLGYRPDSLRAPLVGSGYLMPRTEGRLHTACTFSTTKWPALGDSGLVLVRASAGRDGDDRPAALDDEDLAARLHAEVAPVIGAGSPPVVTRVDRWPQSFPQYEVGHLARVEAVEAALAADAPGIVVAGAAYRGLGIASCVVQAKAAAARVVAGPTSPGAGR
ncbi:MAG TPA: protoporphyrinogen oxidase [Acidimicrobiales bacterium]|nr:protoporphyrinogen oxidase [Acidimicrobiales bacterium]